MVCKYAEEMEILSFNYFKNFVKMCKTINFEICSFNAINLQSNLFCPVYSLPLFAAVVWSFSAQNVIADNDETADDDGSEGDNMSAALYS